MAEDLGEKTEEATPKRREEAREEGNVPRSTDLGGALLLLVGSAGLAVLAGSMLGKAKLGIEAVLSDGLAGDPLNPADTWTVVVTTFSAAIGLAAPLLILVWFAAYGSVFWQVGWLVSPKAVKPKFEKLDPIRGFQRVFGLSAMVKAGLDSLKVALVLTVAAWVVMGHLDQILLLPHLSVLEALTVIGQLMVDLAMRLLVVLLFLGVIDYAYQRWKSSRDLRMTRQQVKDEMKQTEGDPETKRRRMRMAQQITQQRISAAVPKADVVVTNPEHISVAIQYDAETMNAPKVVAKGADFLALRIRQIAIAHAIPIVERKPLARALFKDVEVGQEVPPAFFQAVAEILAYVYRLSGRMVG